MVLAKWNTLSEEQKTEAVQYFIPEVEMLDHVIIMLDHVIIPLTARTLVGPL